MSDTRLQEIVTRAVVGRGERRVVWSQAVPAEGAQSVLGVHVSNVTLSVEEANGETNIQLCATCDLWCNCGEDTRVQRLTCTHSEPAKVSLRSSVVGETETKANLVRGVRCVKAEIQEGQLTLTLETSVTMEVTGLARLWVKTYDLADDLSAGEESSDSTGASSSSSSSSISEVSGDYFEADDREDAGLDDMASLATALPALPAPRTEAPQPAAPALDAARDMYPVRRASVISHFQQSVGSSRVSIVQGH